MNLAFAWNVANDYSSLGCSFPRPKLHEAVHSLSFASNTGRRAPNHPDLRQEMAKVFFENVDSAPWRILADHLAFPDETKLVSPASDLRVTYQRIGTGSGTNICRHVDDTTLPPAQPNSFVLLRVEIIGVVGRFAADMFDPINSFSTSTRSSLW